MCVLSLFSHSLQIVKVVEQADKTFDNAGDTITKALVGSSPMQIMKMVSAVPGNLLKIKDSVKTAVVFAGTIKRVTGELQTSFADMQKALAPAAAA